MVPPFDIHPIIIVGNKWTGVEFFKPNEKWGDPNRMHPWLIYRMDAMRKFAGRPFHVHCGWEERERISYHSKPMSLAADGHFEGLHPLEQLEVASRFDFGGIGVYIWWNNPGIHIDVRHVAEPTTPAAHWGSLHSYKSASETGYVSLNREFFERAIRSLVTDD